MSLSKIFNSFESFAKKISTVLFFLVLLGAVLAERENVVSYFAQAQAMGKALLLAPTVWLWRRVQGDAIVD